jgi:hypothetical protein
VLNLGVVEPFPTPFYRCLLKLRKVVLALSCTFAAILRLNRPILAF